MPREVSSLRRRWSVGVVLALAVLLRGYRLGEQNLWLDEVIHVAIARQSPKEILRNYNPHGDPARRDQAPLSFLLLHPFLSPTHLEWSARLPSAIFGAADVIAIYLIGCELLPAPAPLVAAFLLAISPIHVWYSQEARWYALWGWLTTAAYLALIHAWRRGSPAAWASYAALLVCSVYTFIFTFFVMAGHVVSAWWLSRLQPDRSRFLRTVLAVHAVVVVAALPVLWVVGAQLNLATGTPRPTTWSVLPYTLYAWFAGFTLGPTLAYLHQLPRLTRLVADHPTTLLVFASSVASLGFGALQARQRPEAAAMILPWCVVLPTSVWILAAVTNVTYQVRYSFPAVAAMMLLVGLSSCVERRRGWTRAALATLVACMLASLGNLYWNANYAKEDVRAALAHVRAAAIADARVIPIGQIDFAARFYGSDLPIGPRGDCRPRESTSIGSSEADTDTVWVVVGRDWTNDATRCFEQLGEDYMISEQTHFTGVDLRLLRRRESSGRLPSPDSTM